MTGRRGLVILAVIAVGAAAGGVALHWRLWDEEQAFLIILAGVAILFLAAIVGMFGVLARRRPLRSAAVVLVVVAAGLIAGMTLGPSREPLIHHLGGSATLTLTSPLAATATGPADCTTVASGTEFSVSGDSNMRLETPDRPFVLVFADGGDRWAVRSDRPRSNGTALHLEISPQSVPAGGKPLADVYLATPSSTVDAIFDGAGGRIRFSGLTPEDGTADGTPVDGTLEWTCGPVSE